MNLGSTAAPTDKCTPSLNVLDSIDQWHPLFERSALGVAMIDSGFHFLISGIDPVVGQLEAAADGAARINLAASAPRN
jgi:hypothetical protein